MAAQKMMRMARHCSVLHHTPHIRQERPHSAPLVTFKQIVFYPFPPQVPVLCPPYLTCLSSTASERRAAKTIRAFMMAVNM